MNGIIAQQTAEITDRYQSVNENIVTGGDIRYTTTVLVVTGFRKFRV